MPKGYKKDGSYAGKIFKKGNLAPETAFKKGNIPWHTGKRGEGCPHYKNGMRNNPILRNEYTQKWRKENKERYRLSTNLNRKQWYQKNKEYCIKKNKEWQLKNIEKVRFYKKRNKAMRRQIGFISLKTIQMVYEDNIKRFGTLTCIYCLNPIKFGQDSLEHKQPITRGGTNEYNNLAVACFKCNITKNNKTEGEYNRLTQPLNQT